MQARASLPFPVIDALPLGAHRLSALTDEALFAACGVRIAFTGREGGVSEGAFAGLNCGGHVGDDPVAVERNRRIVCEACGAAAAPLVVPDQVHGTALVRVRSAAGAPQAMQEAERGADGVVVEAPGVAALLNFADCLPVIVVSPSGRFAVAHAGWRGALAGIAGKAVRALTAGDAFGPGDFNAYLGPHIRQECFQVGEDVADRFRDAFGEGAVPSPRHVSLAFAVAADLQRAGMGADRIADAGVCTRCHPDRYFSYRASSGDCGRHAAFAVRPEPPAAAARMTLERTMP